MVATPSTMVELGTPMPDFRLPDTSKGGVVGSDDLLGAKAIVVAFICNHCPYVKHIQDGLAEFGRYCSERGAKMVAVSSNDASTYPADGPREMSRVAAEAGYTFPYLYDEDQSVARRFAAACTPDFFLYDAAAKLAYRGQFDQSRPGNGAPVTGSDLREALDAVLAGRQPTAEQRPSLGCNIKWKRENPTSIG